jgi:hypothetical protein
MDYLAQAPSTMFFAKAGLAVGTTTTTTTANTIVFYYSINGKSGTATGASNGATPTTDINTGAAFLPVGLNKAGVFVFGYNLAGTLLCAQGEIVDYSDAGVFAKAPHFPALPDNFVVIGYELVKVISTGSSWVMGTHNQAALTGITKVFQDCSSLPGRPQTS